MEQTNRKKNYAILFGFARVVFHADLSLSFLLRFCFISLLDTIGIVCAGGRANEYCDNFY